METRNHAAHTAGGVRNDDSITTEGVEALRAATTAFALLQEELAEERSINADLLEQIARVKSRAEIEQRRTAALLESLRKVHRSLFQGSTFEHILRASMDVTGAERGYYVGQTRHGLVVRAAIEVPATVGTRPSPFIAAIAHRVLETGEEVRWTDTEPPAGLHPADDEKFRVGIAVPVATLGDTHGVIIALDKDGAFVDEEVRSLLSVGTEAGVAVENAKLRDEVQRAYVSTIAVLSDAVQAKDPYTHGHCEQVSHYARAAAEHLNLTPDERRVTCYAALLHDVGKIGVSDGVLNKPGPLMEEERRLVEAHVRIGHDLINAVPALKDIASAVLYHHEWYDGSGYPEQLAGDRIPIASRIVAVVDAYCAMLDRRSYKDPLPPEQARSELRRCAGTQFDPQVVEAVLHAIETVDREAAEFGSPSPGCGILPLLSGGAAHSHAA